MAASICKRCGYKWTHPERKAPRCPACKVVDYDTDSAPESCNRSGGVCDICNTEFLVFGIGRDKYCPNCGSDKWSNKKLFECLKCGHRWYSMVSSGPKQCPHREYYFDDKTVTRKEKRCCSRNIREVK